MLVDISYRTGSTQRSVHLGAPVQAGCLYRAVLVLWSWVKDMWSEFLLAVGYRYWRMAGVAMLRNASFRSSGSRGRGDPANLRYPFPVVQCVVNQT